MKDERAPRPIDRFKKHFDVWEDRAAKLSARVLQSPRVLEPSGAALSAAMRGKARIDRALHGAWSTLGLPTRRDQERTLRLLALLERKVIDLEEKLEDAREALAAERRAPEER